jgi:hypothetical protein
MQNALRYFARNARIFTGAALALTFLLIALVPYENAAFGVLLAPLMLVGLAGSAVMFLEDHARIQAQRNS